MKFGIQQANGIIHTIEVSTKNADGSWGEFKTDWTISDTGSYPAESITCVKQVFPIGYSNRTIAKLAMHRLSKSMYEKAPGYYQLRLRKLTPGESFVYPLHKVEKKKFKLQPVSDWTALEMDDLATDLLCDMV